LTQLFHRHGPASSAKDGGWDLKRILPDPVFDCKAGNIPAAAKTVCNG